MKRAFSGEQGLRYAADSEVYETTLTDTYIAGISISES